MAHRLFARVLLIVISIAAPAHSRAHAQSRAYTAYMGA